MKQTKPVKENMKNKLARLKYKGETITLCRIFLNEDHKLKFYSVKRG